MLRVRREQSEALIESRGEFHAWVEDHLRRCFPEFATSQSSAALRAFVSSAQRRAGRFGIRSGPGVCRFADLSVFLGLGFEETAEHAWAARRLVDESFGDPDQRVELVARMAVDRSTPMWPAP